MQAQRLPAELVEGPDDNLDLGMLWRALRRSWIGIVGLCFVVSLIAALMAMRQPPIYRATTTIMIESSQPNPSSIQDIYSVNYATWYYFMTQFEILKSRDIAVLAVDALDLWGTPAEVPAEAVATVDEADKPGWLRGLFTTTADRTAPKVELDPEESRRAAIVDGFMSGLQIEPVENTQLVKVSFESPDRGLVAKVTNTYAQVFIQQHLDSQLQSTREAGDWLSSRLGDLKANLQRSEQALQAFRDSEQLVDVTGVETLAVQELNALNSRLVDARSKRAEAENIFRAVAGSASRSTEDLMRTPAVLQHEMVSELAATEATARQEVENLAKRYGPEHPTMIAAIANFQSTEKQLQEKVLQIAAGIEKEYQIALQNEQDTAGRLAQVKQQVSTLNRTGFRLRELEQQVETDRRLYELFFNRVKETSETLDFKNPHARVVEKAVTPSGSIGPNTNRTIMTAFFVSALLGIGLAILREVLDNTVKSPDDVADKLGVPLLGTLPAVSIPKGYSGPYRGYMEDKNSSFAEATRTIRTGLILSGLDNPHKITVVTSTVPGEGKSTVSINLAAALAQMERVLLIDADLRRPSLAGAFKFPSGCPGLSNAVAQSARLQDCIHAVEYGFDVLPAGVVPTNPLEMISSNRFREMIAQLAREYDRVIIDSAPLKAVSDSLILATMADSLVYVARADSTASTLVLKGIGQLRYSNLPFTGLVLNRLDTKSRSAHSDKYYNSYYGYGADKAKQPA